ncbi:unnamed protein product [Lactuca virosa]|uniref:Uncharacterized protein n=1 Tax=Lactuca virosa TaxID=75947 RepID=A0AAU9NJY2_9ASTR|nr:unnamed protein product [Lactuca virosa]
METGEPSYSGGEDCSDDIEGYIAYSIGFYLVFSPLRIHPLLYFLHLQPQDTLSIITTDHHHSTSDGADDYHIIRFPQGLCDDVISTFPTILYSEAVVTHKSDSVTSANNKYGSGCSICLADYNQLNVLRLMPEDAHVFHLS